MAKASTRRKGMSIWRQKCDGIIKGLFAVDVRASVAVMDDVDIERLWPKPHPGGMVMLLFRSERESPKRQ